MRKGLVLLMAVLTLFVSVCPSLAEEAPKATITVPKLPGTGGDFIRGADVSSLLSLLNSGVTFYDFEGNALDGAGFFRLLKDCGFNWVRLRIWNNPFDAQGRGYGGGNNDLNAAITMGKWAAEAGIRVLVDFHYSDFWADPAKQNAPKAWQGITISEKADALEKFTYDSLSQMIEAGVDVGMVQVGNETNGSMCGENDWKNLCALFSAGSRAVRAVAVQHDRAIDVALHFANPEIVGSYPFYAKTLHENHVDYDIFASSYYPFWHGTPENLTSLLKDIAQTYHKRVMVAETSWAYTLDSGDGHPNTVARGSNDKNAPYPFTVQGQADELVDVVKIILNVGEAGVGVFYWEPAWIPVRVYDGKAETLEESKRLWEKYGSGWAASFAGEYDPKDAGQWFGGSAVDNQALFDFSGHPLESLQIFNLIQAEPPTK